MSVPPPPLPPASHGGPPAGAYPPASGAAPPPKKGLSGCAIAAIVVGVLGVFGIAMVGILAAIAIPQYQDYIVRTQVKAVELQASAVQFAIDDHAAGHGACPDAEAFAAFAGDPMQTGTGDGALTARWEWRAPDADGRCGFDAVISRPGHAIDGATLEFRQDGAGGWTCDGGTLPDAYRRLDCSAIPTSPAVAD